MKTNFHTHHYLCGHASGSCEDYIEEAIKQGFTELGFSDHAPNDEKDLGFRMKNKDYKAYLEDMAYSQSKYENELTIYRGLEIEFFYTTPDYYTQFLKDLDFLVLGQHFISMNKDDQNMISGFDLKTKEEIYAYADTVCDAMRTGMFTIFAHPDLYMCGYLDFDEHAEKVAHQICKCASETNTILEFNANGLRRKKNETPQGYLQPYPRIEFFNIVEQYDVRTILSSDCHAPRQLYDATIKEAEALYKSFKFKKVQYFNEF